MVNHDQERIKARGGQKIGDKIDRELLEGVSTRGGNRGKGRNHGMCIDLHLLAKGTPGDKVANKRGHTGPPVIPRQHGISVEKPPWPEAGDK